MAAILITQGRARLAEMDSRHRTAMDHSSHAEPGNGPDTHGFKPVKTGRHKKKPKT